MESSDIREQLLKDGWQQVWSHATMTDQYDRFEKKQQVVLLHCDLINGRGDLYSQIRLSNLDIDKAGK